MHLKKCMTSTCQASEFISYTHIKSNVAYLPAVNIIPNVIIRGTIPWFVQLACKFMLITCRNFSASL